MNRLEQLHVIISSEAIYGLIQIKAQVPSKCIHKKTLQTVYNLQKAV